ncbi:MAG: hypothetical protein ABIK89_26315, partial [Planctomycetota bacterium]
TFADEPSLHDVEHVIVNLHGSENSDGTLLAGIQQPDGSIEYLTGEMLGHRLQDLGFQGTDVTLVICEAGKVEQSGESFARDVARSSGVSVTAWPHPTRVVRGWLPGPAVIAPGADFWPLALIHTDERTYQPDGPAEGAPKPAPTLSGAQESLGDFAVP